MLAEGLRPASTSRPYSSPSMKAIKLTAGCDCSQGAGPAVAMPATITHAPAVRAILCVRQWCRLGDDEVEAMRHRDLVDHARDRLCLIEGRDDEAQRLHRIPQF